jgi:hypothetical protein
MPLARGGHDRHLAGAEPILGRAANLRIRDLADRQTQQQKEKDDDKRALIIHWGAGARDLFP